MTYVIADKEIQAAVQESPPEENLEPKVVHGVPVDAWVLSNRNRVNLNKVPPPAPGNLRFFVQCMELKSGQANELKEKECRELAARAQPTRPNRF